MLSRALFQPTPLREKNQAFSCMRSITRKPLNSAAGLSYALIDRTRYAKKKKVYRGPLSSHSLHQYTVAPSPLVTCLVVACFLCARDAITIHLLHDACYKNALLSFTMPPPQPL